MYEFRAWHKKNKALIPWEYLKLLHEGRVIVVAEPLTPMLFSKDANMSRTASYDKLSPGNIFDNPEIDVMQFTGMMDISNQKVFEFDILFPRSKDVFTPRAAYVIKVDGQLKIQSIYGWQETFTVELINRLKLEVVGNMFQHKYMLG